LTKSYAKNNFDEEFLPVVIQKDGKPVAVINKEDSVYFFNYRPDRARQLTKAFVLPGIDKFEWDYKRVCIVSMWKYEKDCQRMVAYPPIIMTNCLPRW